MEDRKVKLVFWFCFEDDVRRNWEGISSGSLEAPLPRLQGRKHYLLENVVKNPPAVQ